MMLKRAIHNTRALVDGKSKRLQRDERRREAVVKRFTPGVSAIAAVLMGNTFVWAGVVSPGKHYRWLREREIFLTS
ncbi:hypothetical protein EYF80_000515 [Liparis tanakae]|uniref:Uncharacterized protein n=1 Tax=Liparis tanakae TaxID=230148 RepID=A0A4Z2JGZ6_9TELE|nr:hypothetical protein EYF80_000515 [Liparis tanakae]